MSLWAQLLPKLTNISADVSRNFKHELDLGLAALAQLEKELLNGRLPRDVAELHRINEDEDEPKVPPSVKPATDSERPVEPSGTEPGPVSTAPVVSTDSARAPSSKKRNKEEMGGNNTPEQDKRHKRNASVRAQGIISQQVNVNLTAKLRRPLEAAEAEGESEAAAAAGPGGRTARAGGRQATDRGKENLADNLPLVQVKQEKVSLLAAEATEAGAAERCAADCTAPELPIKREQEDVAAMPPPPAAPAPRSRRGHDKKKAEEVAREREGGGEEEAAAGGQGRRSTRRKPADNAAPPPQPQPPAERRTRASSRVTPKQEEEMPPPPPPETRPKRTRAKKQQVEPATESDTEASEASVDPNENPRPKRTRRGRKPRSKAERVSAGGGASGASGPAGAGEGEEDASASEPKLEPADVRDSSVLEVQESQEKPIDLEETQILSRESDVPPPPPTTAPPPLPTEQLPLAEQQPTTEQPPPTTPDQARAMNETVVLESAAEAAAGAGRGTVVLGRAPALDETVVINKGGAGEGGVGSDQMTNDSLLTEDDSEEIEDTPPRSLIPVKQPTSAVKERVQQFEQLASGARLTRTKTRALAKQSEDGETVSPSDVASHKDVLSASALAKLNTMPLNTYKPNQISSSASKPRSNIISSVKSFLPSSTSKATAASAVAVDAAAAAAAERREREDARRKKEALLEAKREEGRRRREQKMAAAAATREELARERAAQLEATARGRQEKQAHADLGKLEKLKEVEKKRAAMERKAAETEARRRAEEAARQARLEEEQRRAEAARRKQQEEAERIKKEELRVEREMQQARQLYLEKEKEREKQKLLLQKQRMDTDKMHTPMKATGTPCKPMAPVHMADGFQNLNSDTDEEDTKPKRTPPDWSRSKARWEQLMIQEKISTVHIDKLFSVQRHTPDLRELFPAIDRRQLKRTSSAVWRTPPRLPQLPE